jgi:hypothetical protein
MINDHNNLFGLLNSTLYDQLIIVGCVSDLRCTYKFAASQPRLTNVDILTARTCHFAVVIVYHLTLL